MDLKPVAQATAAAGLGAVLLTTATGTAQAVPEAPPCGAAITDVVGHFRAGRPVEADGTTAETPAGTDTLAFFGDGTLNREIELPYRGGPVQRSRDTGTITFQNGAGTLNLGNETGPQPVEFSCSAPPAVDKFTAMGKEWHRLTTP
ncbi:hypothetical protein ACFQVC_23245 [Streptomyces monticola]|uniref:Uncharacterized protein n=1 Tax=Streptomyces monticola TaxID=2666263 RepID=A0ABW2JP96_9ACTN